MLADAERLIGGTQEALATAEEHLANPVRLRPAGSRCAAYRAASPERQFAAAARGGQEAGSGGRRAAADFVGLACTAV